MAGCVVLPSYHEGMSNVLLEAAASGRPLITSNIPGCREAVKDGISGFLCECKNTDSLLDAMMRVIMLSADERAQMGCAGRKLMEETFGKEKVVEETIRNLGILND